jgi:ubiquinone/menaquinone biosynthesis C-methylase UbiE
MMSVVKGRERIKDAYRDQDRVVSYIQSRFEEPFSSGLHQRQVSVINRAIARHRPDSLLEIACGPARLTPQLAYVAKSIAVEQSPGMLEQARQRIRAAGLAQWTLIQGDAFDLQFKPASLDMVVTFRFLRHFNPADRHLLLSQIRTVLRPGGRLIFDVASDAGYRWLLKKWGREGSWVDDYWFGKREFTKEMTSEGFVVEAMYPVHSMLHFQYHLLSSVHRRLPAMARGISRVVTALVPFDPYEWVAMCRSA